MCCDIFVWFVTFLLCYDYDVKRSLTGKTLLGFFYLILYWSADGA